jgi:hypothetical protein
MSMCLRGTVSRMSLHLLVHSWAMSVGAVVVVFGMGDEAGRAMDE